MDADDGYNITKGISNSKSRHNFARILNIYKKKVFIHDNVYWLIYIHVKHSNIKDENIHRHFPGNIIILHENVLFIAGKT